MGAICQRLSLGEKLEVHAMKQTQTFRLGKMNVSYAKEDCHYPYSPLYWMVGGGTAITHTVHLIKSQWSKALIQLWS